MSPAMPVPPHRRATRQHRRREARIVIRPLGRGDFFGWHDAFAAHLALRGHRLDDTHALRVWQWLEATPPRLEAFVAELGEHICGLVHFHETVVPESGTIDVVLQDLYVHPDVRVRGVSDELIAAVHAEAARRGADRICAFKAGNDEASLRYWDRIGDRSDVVAYDLPVRALA